MRALVLALAATALLAAGCSNPCQDLGDRLCKCVPAGTTKASCVDAIKTEVNNLNPGKDTEDVCRQKLDSCYQRSDSAGQPIDFCDWLDGRCGKAACGLSEEDYATLASTPDPDNSAQTLCPP
jgi:hypothetical protein